MKKKWQYNRNRLTEEDFYPPSDERILESHVEDIEGGDNFADYAKYFFDLYDEEYETKLNIEVKKMLGKNFY